MRTLLLSLAAAAALLVGTTAMTARAEPLSGEAGNCVGGAADVRTWRPELGPPAAFIANAYTSAEGTLFIGLGFDETGYWSVEDHTGGDADEGGGILFLAHTSFAGVRTYHPVYDGSEHPSFEGIRPGETPEQFLARYREVQRAVIKKRLFTLAAGPWKVPSLSHDYRLRTPKRTDDGALEFTGWFAEVAKKGQAPLRFGIVGRPFMCWCDYGWRGYALAAPAPETRAKR